MKDTAPFAGGSENIKHPRKDYLPELHDSGRALIFKLGQLPWEDRDICFNEWSRFVDAFEKTFGVGDRK